MKTVKKVPGHSSRIEAGQCARTSTVALGVVQDGVDNRRLRDNYISQRVTNGWKLRDLVPPGYGLDARLMLLYKQTVAKPKEVKTCWYNCDDSCRIF